MCAEHCLLKVISQDVFRRNFNTNLSSVTYLNMEEKFRKLTKQTGSCQLDIRKSVDCLQKLYFIEFIESSVTNIRIYIYRHIVFAVS